MLSPGAQRLAQEQARSRPPQDTTYLRMWSGVVTAIDAGDASDGEDLLTVEYAGATQKVAYLESYTPHLDDTVVVLVSSDGALLVLGKPIGTPTS